MSKAQPAIDQAMSQLEDMRINGLLDTEEKKDRYKKAARSGYSKEFALIFALQD